MRNQKGIAHILVIVLLVIGLAVGIYLVTHPAIFKSHAANDSNLQVKGTFYNNGSATSRLLLVRPTYVGSEVPKYFRLANDPGQLDTGQVFDYIADDSTRPFSLWNLGLEDSDAPGQGVGNHTIYTQFYVDGKWTTPLLTDIRLEPTNNSLKLAASCNFDQYSGKGPFPVTIKWDTGATGKADALVMMMFRGQGGYLSDSGQTPLDPKSGSVSFKVPSIADNYSVFATGTTGDQTAVTSELSFSCTKQVKSEGITNLRVQCNEANCQIANWRQGGSQTFNEVTIYQLDPLTSTQSIAQSVVVPGVNNVAQMSVPLLGTYPRWSVIGLQPATDPQAAGLITKTPVFAPAAFNSNGSDTGSLNPPSLLSCTVNATAQSDGSYKISYSGNGGPVRVWLESKDLVTPVSSILVDGAGPIRTYTGAFENYGTVTQYQIGSCEGAGAGSCSGAINKLNVPAGQYSVHCDVLASTNKCSGYTACSAEGGSLNCVSKLNTASCGANDHVEFSR